ncbi:MAG: vWA domain-containing protein [Planctomycetota bacterium]
MPRSAASDALVAVSNGVEFLVVPESSVDELRQRGFYRPSQKGLTILSKDGRLFEVPNDLRAAATSQGYRDLLHRHDLSDSLGAVVAQETRPSPTTDSTETSSRAPQALMAETPSMEEVLARAEANEAAAQSARQEAIDASTGWQRWWLQTSYSVQQQRQVWMQQLGTSGISLLIHVAILMLLASVWLVNETPRDSVILASANAESELIEEFVVETEPIEITEPDVSEPTSAAPVEEVVPSLTEVAPTPDFMASVQAESLRPPTPPAGESVALDAGKAKVKPTMFGSKFTARTFVFVIDNSNSMTNGRFETALIELMRTVDQLTPKQRFYVAFYSDTAYGMMFPNVVTNLVPATNQNKEYLRRWLGTVELCLKTNGREAIEAAMALKPDVIYVLGDGAFTDGAAKFFAQRPNRSVTLHTRGMEVKPSAAVAFQELATTHRGTYRDVGVSPEGAALAKRFPRKRNRVRGPVWGVNLRPDMMN